MTRGGWVYLLSNRPNGTLYIGVTANLQRRVWEHRNGEGAEFTRRYGLDRLVYAEFHEDIRAAIAREKALKRWRRAWKVRLIQAANPEWNDLYDTLAWPSWSRSARPSTTSRSRPSDGRNGE